MSRRTLIIAALLTGALLSLMSFPAGRDTLLFRLDRGATAGEAREVRETLRQFTAGLAGFYVSGGIMAGINIFPADNQVKRSIFQDLRVLEFRGMVLAIDKDRFFLDSLVLLNRTHAVAITEEHWVKEYQQAKTRTSLGKGPNKVRVRYFLNKRWGKWIVMDYEVYGADDPIPSLDPDKVVRTWP